MEFRALLARSVEGLSRFQGHVVGGLVRSIRLSKALRSECHVQGSWGGRCREEHGCIKIRGIGDEWGRQGRVGHLSRLRFMEEASGGCEMDNPDELSLRNARKIGHILDGHAFKHGDAG